MTAIALLVQLVGALSVSGSAHCPSPEEVSARLEAFSSGNPIASSQHGRVDETENGIQLRLFDAEDRLIAERTLPAGKACSLLAQASAVVFASWEARFIPPTVELPSLDAAASIRRPAVQSAPEVVRTVPVDLGFRVGLSGVLLGDGLEPGLRLEEALGSPGGRFAGLLSLEATLPRQVSLGSGAARWSRQSVALSGVYRPLQRPFQLDVEVGALAALLIAEGLGQAPNRNPNTVDVGGRLGLRATLPIAFHPWALVDATFWPIPHALQVGVAEASYQLPVYELALTLGVGFDFVGKVPETRWTN